MIGIESMPNPLTFAQLDALCASKPPVDSFGPDSPYPYLAFDLTGSKRAMSEWLCTLPCPVIGIGDGALKDACDVVLADGARLAAISKNIRRAPIAAMVFVQHLRASQSLSLPDALTAESFAYSTVQNGPEFQDWLSYSKQSALPASDAENVLAGRKNDTLSLTLNRADTHNAIGVEMRDELSEALDLALLDDDIEKIHLTGSGSAFSVGGAIEEFGEVSDPATAHWIRSLRLPAWRLAKFKGAFNVHVNGAAIGAGVEIAAFGDFVSASSNAWFQLPELKYGLIPGAGGTVIIPRRIGRQRTAYMALSMEKIRAKTALEWGLIDAIID